MASASDQVGIDLRAHAVLGILVGAFSLVFSLVAFYGFALAFVYTAKIGCWGSFVILVVTVILVARGPNTRIARISGRSWFKVFLAMQLASIPIMLVVAWSFLGSTGQDYHQLFSIATAHVRGEDIPYFVKYGNYPNNHLLLMFMIGLFELVNTIVPGADDTTFMWVHVVINVVFVQLSFLLVAFAARRVWGARRGAVAGLLMLICSPIWLNVSNPYSDTGALLFVSLAIWCVALFFTAKRPHSIRENPAFAKRIIMVMVFAAICVIGFKVKATVAVIAVAFALTVLLAMQARAAAKVIFSMSIAAAVSLTCVNAAIDQARPDDLPYDSAIHDSYAFPYEHWFMMMLNPDGGGVYVLDDYKFTDSFDSLDAKRQAVREEIVSRMNELGPLGVIKRVAFEKPSALWKNGACIRDDELEEWLSADSNASGAFFLYMNYAQAFQMVMLGGVFLSALWLLRNRNLAAVNLASMRKGDESEVAIRCAMLILLMMALFGFSTFICLIWEAKVRYVVHFMPILILLEAEGLAALRKGLSESSSNQPNHKTRKKISKRPERVANEEC